MSLAKREVHEIKEAIMAKGKKKSSKVKPSAGGSKTLLSNIKAK